MFLQGAMSTRTKTATVSLFDCLFLFQGCIFSFKRFVFKHANWTVIVSMENIDFFIFSWKATSVPSHKIIFHLTRMHSSRMRTARSSSRPGGSPPGTPQDQAPPGPGTPPEQALPPGSRHPPGAGTPPPVDRITDACENITLPQLRCGR